MMTLAGSLRRALRGCELMKTLSQSALCNRFKKGRLGIVKGKPVLDFSDICACWDMVVDKKLAQTLEDMKSSLRAILLCYWDEFEATVEPNFEIPRETLGYYEALQAYIEDAAVRAPAARAALDEDALNTLVSTETVAVSMLGDPSEGMRSLVIELVRHGGLRDATRNALIREVSYPTPLVLTIHSDFQDNGTAPIGPKQTSAEWCAGSRLGYSACAWKCWSAYHPRKAASGS